MKRIDDSYKIRLDENGKWPCNCINDFIDCLLSWQLDCAYLAEYINLIPSDALTSPRRGILDVLAASFLADLSRVISANVFPTPLPDLEAVSNLLNNVITVCECIPQNKHVVPTASLLSDC